MKLLLPLLMLAAGPAGAAAIPSVVGRVVAAAAPSPSRIEQIEARYADVPELRGAWMMRLDAYRRSADPEKSEKLLKVHRLMSEALTEQQVKTELQRRELRRKLAEGEISESRFQKASSALDSRSALGRLFVYGHALPSLLEELEPGKGGEVVLTYDEWQGLDAVYRERAGLGPND